MSDEEQRTPEALHGRLIRLETQRNGALGIVVLFAGGLFAGAWNVSQQATRLEERVTRLAVDVQGQAAAVGRIDRMEERLDSVGRSVGRIESDVSRVRESVDGLRTDLGVARVAQTAARRMNNDRPLAQR